MDQPNILSKRGKEKFANEGFVYVFDRFSTDQRRKFWRCENKHACKARIHTLDGVLTRQLGEHTHDSSAAAVEVQAIVTQLKRRSGLTLEPTAQVINQTMTGASAGAQGVMPNLGALRKVVRCRRNEINHVPAAPISLATLVIPDQYQVYSPTINVRERFILFDSGPGNDRIIIFGRDHNLQVLQESEAWFVDGTFPPTPPLFSQVYTIMAERLGGVHAVVYALLPDKQQATYDRLFDALNNLKPGLNPRSISVDFEALAIRAMRNQNPNAEIHGCFFHLHRNMKKHLARLGLTARYNTDADFAVKARMVVALAFVPVDDLDHSIAYLADYLPPELHPLLEWLEDNYVGRINRFNNGQRRQPLFPPNIWSLYNRVLNRQHRTNNHAEAAHRRIQAELGMDHPTIWKFIEGLRKVQKGRDMYYEQLVAGHAPTPKLRKYIAVDQRILRIVQNYRNRNIIDYLRGLSYNFEMNP